MLDLVGEHSALCKDWKGWTSYMFVAREAFAYEKGFGA